MNKIVHGTLASVIAGYLSYAVGNSVGWVILHSLFGGGYVIYYAYTMAGIL
jgi:hypothetical protein